ncbi:Uncharacterized membrane protein [Faunimonas pinastri]|uniref:Uncharacterized membrane protein n=1 Tax=Faunimonas pinastri TaxID=1855383 RepID=A0A1H9KEA0_9HYPH|nr:DUF2254 domain-containing protein [Faunimonas pinastri]SEQ97247.1 Uncharacterized membrane protein [Faunimonas pinastri]
MLPRLLAFYERVRTSLWFLPVLMTLEAAVIAWVALRIHLELDLDSRVWWLNQSNAQNASNLLSSLLSSLVTMATLVISITMVVLTLAANQLGPRLIRSFMADLRTQAVLGLFIGTIVYLVLVFRAIDTDLPKEAVPHVAVTSGTVLFLVCVFTLLFYVHHLGRSIVADNVVNRIGARLDEAIADNLPEIGEADAPVPPHLVREAASAFGLPESGYVQYIAHDAIAEAAAKRNVYVEINFRPGMHLIRKREHVFIWPSDLLDEDLRSAIAGAVVIGEERTAASDLEFSLRQLVEIALRALSPGINDPYTAIAVIDRLASSLAAVMERGEPRQVWTDGGGTPRLTAFASTFSGLVDVAYSQIRQAAATQPAVLLRLLEALTSLARRPRTDAQARVLRTQIEAVAATARKAMTVPHDCEALEERIAEAEGVMERAEPRA